MKQEHLRVRTRNPKQDHAEVRAETEVYSSGTRTIMGPARGPDAVRPGTTSLHTRANPRGMLVLGGWGHTTRPRSQGPSVCVERETEAGLRRRISTQTFKADGHTASGRKDSPLGKAMGPLC